MSERLRKIDCWIADRTFNGAGGLSGAQYRYLFDTCESAIKEEPDNPDNGIIKRYREIAERYMGEDFDLEPVIDYIEGYRTHPRDDGGPVRTMEDAWSALVNAKELLRETAGPVVLALMPDGTYVDVGIDANDIIRALLGMWKTNVVSKDLVRELRPQRGKPGTGGDNLSDPEEPVPDWYCSNCGEGQVLEHTHTCDECNHTHFLDMGEVEIEIHSRLGEYKQKLNDEFIPGCYELIPERAALKATYQAMIKELKELYNKFKRYDPPEDDDR